MVRATRKSLPPETDVMDAFTGWIGDCLPSEAVVLDIGAGYDRNRVDATLQPLVGRLVGIDLSPSILDNAALHERRQVGVEQFAGSDGRQFDVVVAAWVLEHVDQPSAFFAACRSLLKPGGALFAITPNLWHYFGLITKGASTLGVEDWLLARVIGVTHRAEYHVPTRYRSNSIRAITRTLDQAGFESVEFRLCDSPAGYDYVVPPSLRWVPRAYSGFVYRLGLQSCMGRIMFRATVAAGV